VGLRPTPRFFYKSFKKVKLLRDNCIERAIARNPAPGEAFMGLSLSAPLFKKQKFCMIIVYNTKIVNSYPRRPSLAEIEGHSYL
jgi:hypothetical protein